MKGLQPDKATPGPGTYKPIRPLGSDCKTFKLKSRLDYGDPAQMARKKGVPDPGAYELKGIDKFGEYINSEQPNSRSARWSKDDRMKHLSALPGNVKDTPGPGAHEPKGCVADLNGSHLSHFHSLMDQRGFGTKTSIRTVQPSPRFNTPGPGTYRVPSDFGYVTIRDQEMQKAQEDSIMSVKLQTISEKKHRSVAKKRRSLQIDPYLTQNSRFNKTQGSKI